MRTTHLLEGLPGRRPEDRRKTSRRAEDTALQQALLNTTRKLNALMELGGIIGLDLQIDGMLLQIAQKAAEVMEAERCSIFLHDALREELWSTVAMGLEGQEIRIPSGAGLAGHCFRTGETINLEDAYQDPRFNREVDARTGYQTRSVLCMPLYNRAGKILGVIQLLNNKSGVFSPEDEALLLTFCNHASLFLEIAQLQKARIEALEESQAELRRLHRVKDKALHHLAHELRTPLAVLQGLIRLLKRKIHGLTPSGLELGPYFDPIERNLNRLLEIQRETDSILRAHGKPVGSFLREEFDRLWEHLEAVTEVPRNLRDSWQLIRAWMTTQAPRQETQAESFRLVSMVEQIVEEVRDRAAHRLLSIDLEGEEDLVVRTNPEILREILEGLLRNAVENTPDEGWIRIGLERGEQRVLIKVEDHGIGISDENQKHIFEGLFPTQEIELYASKNPYDFNAGGKGLGLLRMKVHGQRLGLDLWVESRRCAYLPTDGDLCQGRISACPHCQGPEDCLRSGGSIFGLSVPAAGKETPVR